MKGKRGWRARLALRQTGNRRSGRTVVRLVALATTCAISTAPAFAGRLGDEFLVNTCTAGDQYASSVAMDGEGNFVVAWASDGQDGDGVGVFAQRYDASGAPAGDEFQVNSYITSYQGHPYVAMGASGDFVIAWISDGQDGDGYGVFAQRYDASGVAQGDEFQVDIDAEGDQYYPSVAVDDAGNFVVVWGSRDCCTWDVYAQRYDASGVVQGSKFQVNVTGCCGDYSRSVAMDPWGEFAVAWSSGNGAYARLYDASGVPEGDEFRVDSYAIHSGGNGFWPCVAMDASGGFVVVWARLEGANSSDFGVYARRFDMLGLAQGAEFRVNTSRRDSRWTISPITNCPGVAMDASGNFVVVWPLIREGDDDEGLYAQRYNASGLPRGSEFTVKKPASNVYQSRYVAMDPDGDFVVTWNEHDGSGWGVFAQRFDFFSPNVWITTNSGRDFTVGISPFPIAGTTDPETVEMRLNGLPMPSYSAGSTEWGVEVDLAAKANAVDVVAVDNEDNECAPVTITITYDSENDADGDGILDRMEGLEDVDGDHLANYLDTDSDGDGMSDAFEGDGDPDADEVPNYLDTDSDADDVPDDTERCLGSDPYDPLSPTVVPTAWWPVALALLAAGLLLLGRGCRAGVT